MSHPRQQTQPKQQTENQVAAGMKIYRDDVNGFEFQYPADEQVMVYKPSNRFGTGTGYAVGGPDEPSFEGVDVKANSSNKTLQQVFDENYNSLKAESLSGADFKLKDFYVSDIKIDGQDAKELYIDNFGDVGSTMISIVDAGHIYLIAGGVKKGDIDQFVSTFKFDK